MKATKEIFDRLLPGDYVVMKTLGQLIDTGVVGLEEEYSYIIEDAKPYLGKMFPVEEVHVINDKTYVSLKYDEEGYLFELEMFSELYPLNRGYY